MRWIPLIRVGMVTAALNGSACSTDSPPSNTSGGAPGANGGSSSAGRPSASGGMANAGSAGLGSSGNAGSGSYVSGGSANAGGAPGVGGAASVGGTMAGAGAAGVGAAGSFSSGGASQGGSTSAGASSVGGAAGSSGMGTGGQAGSATGGRPAVDCSGLPEAPVEFETLSGFAPSEDFAFDLNGNYIGVDENENLVRITKDKRKSLWSPSLGEAAGMGLLPDGSLVFCNVDEGALQRVHANGSVSTVLGGLLYPNGLEIGPDGFVYVAENAAGRVRRVNVETGEFTVVAMGLQGPNGVAFSPDPNVFYVGSFEGSGVYRVAMPSAGELGQARVFARPNGSQLKEPMLACPAMQEGVDCEVPGQFDGGTCRRLANVIDCVKDTTIGACNDFGCTMSEYGGGIDGLGVDACGNVYATEYEYATLWRISPSGTMEKLVASFPAMWIPNMKWGRGIGGFDSDVLFVADRDEGRLFAVPVGVPGASSLFGVGQ